MQNVFLLSDCPNQNVSLSQHQGKDQQPLRSSSTNQMYSSNSPRSSRGVGQLQVGDVRQLHLQGAARVSQEQQRRAVLHLLRRDAERRERLPELQDQPESGSAVLRQLLPQRVPGPAHQQAR